MHDPKIGGGGSAFTTRRFASYITVDVEEEGEGKEGEKQLQEEQQSTAEDKKIVDDNDRESLDERRAPASEKGEAKGKKKGTSTGRPSVKRNSSRIRKACNSRKRPRISVVTY